MLFDYFLKLFQKLVGDFLTTDSYKGDSLTFSRLAGLPSVCTRVALAHLFSEGLPTPPTGTWLPVDDYMTQLSPFPLQLH